MSPSSVSQMCRMVATAIGMVFVSMCLVSAEVRDEWIDPDTGHRILRLSRVPGENRNLYFYRNAFTATGDKVVYENRPYGSRGTRIYAYNFKTGESELIVEDGGRVIRVGAGSRVVFYQRSNTVYATHLDTRETKTLAELPSGWRVTSINASEKLGAGTCLDDGSQSVISRREPGWFERRFEAGLPGGIFIVDFDVGKPKVILRGTNWYNHLQFSPTDPTLLQFCHEGPWHRVDRIWHIRTDGSGLRLIHRRTSPMEIAGHEFWSPDGRVVWFDLQRPRGEAFFLEGVDIRSGKRTRYPIERDTWSVHYNVSWDGLLFAGDGGAPNMVARAKDGQWIYLFTPQPDGTLKADRLVNLAKHNYTLEPNVQFSPDGKWIVFGANFDGLPQVYAVEVAKTVQPVGARFRQRSTTIFNVADFGAVGDGKTLCTAAIQKAIDTAAAAGGGVVVFPKGKFLTGAIFVKSNVEFRVDEGVELHAITDDRHYPEMPTRVAGIEMVWPAALVNVYAQQNVRIAGKGLVDGHGEFWWHKFWGEDGKGGMLKNYRDRGLRWAVDYDCKRVRALVVYDSKDVEIRDLTFKRPGFWTIQITYSERVTVDGVTIRANVSLPVNEIIGEVTEGDVTIRGNIRGYGPSSDGINIDSSRDVLVQNNDIDCNDDNICLKAGRDADGLRVNRPTEHVVIRNCITRAGHGMLTIGSETSGGIRNIHAYNLRAIGTSNGIRFKSARTRGGVVENIHIHNVEMENVANPLHWELNWYPAYSYPAIPPGMSAKDVPPHWQVLTQRVEPPERGIPEFHGITISNLRAKGAKQAVYVNAHSEKPIRDVRLEKISIEAQRGGVFNNAADWTFNNVRITVPTGENTPNRVAARVVVARKLEM